MRLKEPQSHALLGKTHKIAPEDANEAPPVPAR